MTRVVEGGGVRRQPPRDGVVDFWFEGVEPVGFNCVARSSDDDLRHLGPLVTEPVVRIDELSILLESPRVTFDVGVEITLPTLSTLSGVSSGHLRGNLGPLAAPVGLHDRYEPRVLLLGEPSLHRG